LPQKTNLKQTPTKNKIFPFAPSYTNKTPKTSPQEKKACKNHSFIRKKELAQKIPKKQKKIKNIFDIKHKLYRRWKSKLIEEIE
jgi:hypothetical protein